MKKKNYFDNFCIKKKKALKGLDTQAPENTTQFSQF